ncbi:RnfABCDGE type electron transport complex subunit G [Lepagella muris]|jgi:electron transport complex protein RnfG|uniref:RnfABCDGE type electron transport complex subunit G n=1 Tax=Lepagella muris TaxID=3032870 RepID=A0AC61RK65_9BACT|nr:RnfABCDGE type electron transport complex subunit G [Lepagella muris]ROT05869.1 RnfABCDGE type electron transport complex subunit G [Muribaculaceae bacterium Isolate-037 (Harlan)]TGY79145.1 RnfABCDGE type electron transport complex subunit G [Lepagella muris]THG46809.1 RnfABCDGE type electron transport complex subunit G [Bacteroidales bacterium]TKC59428.1 RnfABCDGE type electron transport complex subunit G [Bacteroidales bacterium]
MKKLASTLPNMILSLGIITIASGALLGWVYSITKEPIALQAAAQQQAAIAEVAPAFDNNPEADKWETEINGVPFTVYPAYDDGKLVGAAVKGSSMNGFAGEITVMCGFEADGTVKDYRVLQQAETPGLGTKMEPWFRDPAGARSVIGKNPASTSFFVTKDSGGEIDGITAATISSRAFLETMRNAYEAYRNYEKNKSN